MKKAALAVIILGFSVIPCWATSAYDDLAKLVKSGTNEDVIIAFIDSYKNDFALTPDNIVQLKNLGASDKVITAAIEHKKPSANSSEENTATPADPQPSTSSPDTVVSQQPAQPPTVVYQTEPSTGGWIFVNGDWYWRYPTGIIVDLKWRPFFFHNHFYSHWGYYHRGYSHWGYSHGGYSHAPYHHGFCRGGWHR